MGKNKAIEKVSDSLQIILFAWSNLGFEPRQFGFMEKAMAPHSSTLAWRIPGTGEPGGLLSMGSHRVGHG